MKPNCFCCSYPSLVQGGPGPERCPVQCPQVRPTGTPSLSFLAFLTCTFSEWHLWLFSFRVERAIVVSRYSLQFYLSFYIENFQLVGWNILHEPTGRERQRWFHWTERRAREYTQTCESTRVVKILCIITTFLKPLATLCANVAEEQGSVGCASRARCH